MKNGTTRAAKSLAALVAGAPTSADAQLAPALKTVFDPKWRGVRLGESLVVTEVVPVGALDDILEFRSAAEWRARLEPSMAPPHHVRPNRLLVHDPAGDREAATQPVARDVFGQYDSLSLVFV